MATEALSGPAVHSLLPAHLQKRFAARDAERRSRREDSVDGYATGQAGYDSTVAPGVDPKLIWPQLWSWEPGCCGLFSKFPGKESAAGGSSTAGDHQVVCKS